MNNLFNGFNPMMQFSQPFQPQNMQPTPTGFGQSKINPTQFQQMVPGLSTEILVQLVQQARAQGISEADIESGLNFIKQIGNQK